MKLGLNDNEVKESIKKYGSNNIASPKPRTIFNMIIESFSDPIIKILLIALAIKIVFIFKDFNWYETLGIIIAIFLATLISSISEYGSEAAFKKIEEENKDITCKCYRNNRLINIKLSEVVVGDLILIEQGDIIPADGIIKKGSIKVDESILTGESNEILKDAKKENNYVYRGTVVNEGLSYFVVDKVGTNTMYGKIASEITEVKTTSPLKTRLLGLAKIINKVGYIGSFLVAFSYLFSVIVIKNNFDLNLIKLYIQNHGIINDVIYAVTLCVTVIVVAVPEGLPMMITLVLSSNMKKMIKNNVLVRKMVGIEAAGNINYLLTDKTGTITEGNLKMVSYISPDFKVYSDINKLSGDYKRIIIESLIYNNASTLTDNNVVGGNETDKAIIKFLKNVYYKDKDSYKYIPFDSKTKTSEVYINNKHYIKGAYDVLIEKATHIISSKNKTTIIDKQKINIYISSLTKKGYRLIANMMVKDDMYILLGIITIKDTIRKESYEGLNKIKKAGINVIMVTGDHKDTADTIAKEVGIYNSFDDVSISSKELSLLKDEELYSKIDKIKVVSRALPSDKSRLVRILQEKGYIVGMTGDGVNDAPALKRANVGFAMGTGTSISKESSDIVILDNNLLSISKAILYGRTIFKSIRKFIKYQLSVNLCALTLSIIGPFIGINTPITIVQMLWLNMIMDTFAGLAFSFEPSQEKYLEEKPKSIKEPVINKRMYIEILINGLSCAILCILFLKLPIIRNIFSSNKEFMTAYFALFIFMGINIAFLTRSNQINIFKGINKNPLFVLIFILIILMQIFIIYFGGDIFSTYGLNTHELLTVILLSLFIIIPGTIRKIIIKEKDD